jgi:DNA polymerase-3 subunit gamma/tau
LKTLEEPPPRVKFVFATTEYHKIPETILSRCQQFDFRMIPARELAAHLRHVADAEGIAVSDGAIGLVARAAEGSARDALSLFDQVLAFTGQQVNDDEVAGLLGLVDRELLHRASRAIVEGDSLGILELVESLADYGADYRNFVRELLLHLREVLVVKLAPEGSALVASVLPDELERLRALAGALSEEDLLRALDLLTRVEGELRSATDPRVALDLALLKLVQMRRLMPFAELVARVERLAGGAAALPAPAARLPETRPAPRADAPRPAPAPPPPAPVPRAAAPAPPRPEPEPEFGPDAEPEVDLGPPPSPAGEGALLAKMIGLAATRPSLQAALRSARARVEGQTLVIEVAPEFVPFATLHLDEYRELARKAAGRALAPRIVAGAPIAEAGEKAAEKGEAEARRSRLREEAEKEPAVQEALDLFEGRVVDVREAKASREEP